MCQSQEAELAATTTETGQYHAGELDGNRLGGGCQGDEHHAGGRKTGEDKYTDGIRDAMDEVGGNELGQERRYDVGKQDDAFREVADEILGGGQDDNVENIVD